MSCVRFLVYLFTMLYRHDSWLSFEVFEGFFRFVNTFCILCRSWLAMAPTATMMFLLPKAHGMLSWFVC